VRWRGGFFEERNPPDSPPSGSRARPGQLDEAERLGIDTDRQREGERGAGDGERPDNHQQSEPDSCGEPPGERGQDRHRDGRKCGEQHGGSDDYMLDMPGTLVIQGLEPERRSPSPSRRQHSMQP